MQQSKINLLNGDCLELMKTIPDGSVDMVLTDPPYRTISGGNKANVSLAKSMGGNNGKVFKHNDISFSMWVPEVFRILKDNSHAYFMTNFMNLFALQKELTCSGFNIHNLLVWQKNTCTANRWYMKNAEYTLFARKGAAKTINNPSSKVVHSFNNPRDKRHPTEKPVELMEYYIKNSSTSFDTVFDPFMGSGTTGVAAVQMGRKFIGIEREPKYFDMTCKRIEEAQRQGDMFTPQPETPKPVQEGFDLENNT